MTLKDSVYSSVSRSQYSVGIRRHFSNIVVTHTSITCWHPIAVNTCNIVSASTALNCVTEFVNDKIKSYAV